MFSSKDILEGMVGEVTRFSPSNREEKQHAFLVVGYDGALMSEDFGDESSGNSDDSPSHTEADDNQVYVREGAKTPTRCQLDTIPEWLWWGAPVPSGKLLVPAVGGYERATQRSDADPTRYWPEPARARG